MVVRLSFSSCHSFAAFAVPFVPLSPCLVGWVYRFPNKTFPTRKLLEHCAPRWSLRFIDYKSSASAHIIDSDMLKSVPMSLPTIDQPFGVDLMSYFEKAYSAVAGYSPRDFVFVPGETPLSTFKATAGLLLTYYFTVFAGRELMKNRAPLRLNGLFMVHNLYLTIISATLLALFIEQLLPTIWRNGVFFAICDHRGGWTKPLVTLYYVSQIATTLNWYLADYVVLS